MNTPEPPPIKSIEEVTQFNDYLGEQVVPFFTWASESLVTLYQSWVAYAVQARAAGNTAEYERAIRWASDNYAPTLSQAQAALASCRSAASPSPAPATSTPTNVPALEPDHLRSAPVDESVCAPAGTPSQEIVGERAAHGAPGGTQIEAPAAAPTTTSSSESPTATRPIDPDGTELTAGAVAVVNVGSIVIDDDRRARADAEHVSKLAESIRVVGLQNPPVVTRGGRLVSGLHRVLACILVGLTEIRVSVVDLSGVQQRIALIDENLVRRNLPALERAELVSERKELYERAHPETVQYRRGGESKAAGGATAIDAVAPAFASTTAELTGRSTRSIRLDSEVAQLPQSVRDAIRGTTVADKITELKKLLGLPSAEQSAVVSAIQDGRAARVAQALAIVKGAAAQTYETPTETGAASPEAAPESDYARSQRKVLREQRGIIRKTRASLNQAIKAWSEHDALGMDRHIHRVRKLVVVATSVLAEMCGDAVKHPDLWGEPKNTANSSTTMKRAKAKSRSAPKRTAASKAKPVKTTRAKPRKTTKAKPGSRKRAAGKKRKAA